MSYVQSFIVAGWPSIVKQVLDIVLGDIWVCVLQEVFYYFLLYDISLVWDGF